MSLCHEPKVGVIPSSCIAEPFLRKKTKSLRKIKRNFREKKRKGGREGKNKEKKKTRLSLIFPETELGPSGCCRHV